MYVCYDLFLKFLVIQIMFLDSDKNEECIGFFYF